ncbi:Mur ligase family protein [Candidatus Cytomitobacter primus]|uniref:UDP-N-acetylmuramate--L-alanine ligase n=1 Tax=Candidatus Cytomitobacter primus TaxID=2066024 RepID=A0A5C0UHN5_9PROT|nr:Mur ligase family protein [Candidatus Cytomitobacter primus]QEK38504.1 hypothetical protein FZC34_01100 [Candidatus Cytomitobacter primus]
MKNLWKTDGLPSNDIKKAHMIGVAGLGMQSLKTWLDTKNYQITGTDDYQHKSWMLKSDQMPIDTDCIIVSSVIKPNHPQCLWAIQNNIPIFHRASFAKYLLSKESICISGSHGKTTTSGLTTWILYNANLNPSFMLGDQIQNLKSSAQYNAHDISMHNKDFQHISKQNGDSEYNNKANHKPQNICVIESDESDGSMQKLTGKTNIITNIDEDHMDYYKDRSNLLCSFQNFADQCEKCICHINVKNALNIPNAITYSIQNDTSNPINAQHHTIGSNLHGSDIYAENIKFHKNGMLFDVKGLINMKDVFLNIPGIYNIENALAAIAVIIQYNISEETLRTSLSTFKGMKKRIETHKHNDIDFILDYAHHPHSLKLLLQTLSNQKYNNIYCIIEIHKYSRLKKDFDNFVKHISTMKHVALLPVHNVNEYEDSDLFENFYQSIKRHQSAEQNIKLHQNFQISTYNTSCIKVKSIQDIQQFIQSAQKSDAVLFIGAGSVCKLYYDLVNILN